MDDAEKLTIEIGEDEEARIVRLYNEALETSLKEHKELLKELKALDVEYKFLPEDWDDERKKTWLANEKSKLIKKSGLVNDLADELEKAGLNATKLIKDVNANVYGISRKFTVEEIRKVVPNVDFKVYDKNQLKVLLQKTETPFSKIAYGNLVDKDRLTKELSDELFKSTLLGENQDKIIERIIKVTGYNVNRAKRIAQTERNRVQSQGRYETMREGKEMGIKIKKQWLTRMVDSRESHIELNGKIVEFDEEFGFDLRYPGDPQATAEQVINCHCVLIPIVEKNE